MYQVVVYDGSVTNGTTDSDLPAVQDQTNQRQNSHYMFSRDWKLVSALYLGTNANRARLQSPKLRGINPPYIYPHNAAAAMPSDPAIADYRDFPLVLPYDEEIAVEVTHTDAAPQRQTVGLWLSDGNLSAPTGSETYTIRATAAITAVANAWTAGPLTFGTALPHGQYDIISGAVQSATILFWRLIFQEGGPRPGGAGVTAIGNKTWGYGRRSPWGRLGRFWNQTPPQLEIFCTAADAAQVVLLDVVKVA